MILTYLWLLVDQGFEIYAIHHDFRSSRIDLTQVLTKDRLSCV